MMGPSHRIAGVVAWLALAPTLHQVQWQHLLVGALFAMAFAHGMLSPDVDQKLGWHHRGVTHFWLWPALVFLCGRAFALDRIHLLQAPPTWCATMLYAVAVAWTSHILTDAVFGRIPILPRLRRRSRRHTRSMPWRSPHWQYAGLGFTTGGGVEKWLAVPAMIAAGGYLIWGMA